MRISDWSSDVCSSALAITILIDYARECGSEADGDHRVFIDRTLQDGLDLDLTDTERRFAGVMAIVFSADDLALLVRRGVLETVKFMPDERSEEHTSELQSLMRNWYALICLNKKKLNIARPE